MTDIEVKDESFEIITLKEKYLRDQLSIAEDAFMKSEVNVLINKDIIKRLNDEISKEHKNTQ